jgi:lysophospholipase L1-like esterase
MSWAVRFLHALSAALGRAISWAIDGTVGFRLLLWLLDSAFVVSMLVLPAIWLLDPLNVALGGRVRLTIDWDFKVALAPILPLTARVLAARWSASSKRPASALWERVRMKEVTLAVTTVYLCFGALEGVLALAGYEADLAPVVFQGYGEEITPKPRNTLPDHELLWKFKPGSEFHGRTINSLGFREREVNPRKKPGTRRVICMGDSVTGQGKPGYSQYLHDLLNVNPPTPEPWEAFNVGVHGYHILQGLRQLRKTVVDLQPDIVTIHFGWNAHWLDDKPASQRMAIRVSPLQGRLYNRLKEKRFFAFLVSISNPVRNLAWKGGDKKTYRVPPDEYRWALGTLITEVRESGAVPVVITAARGELNEEIVRKGYALTVQDAEDIHDRYVQITREVAKQHGAALVDLAAVLAGPEAAGLFAPDGIHFDSYHLEGSADTDALDQPGLRRVAQEIYKGISRLVSDGG